MASYYRSCSRTSCQVSVSPNIPSCRVRMSIRQSRCMSRDDNIRRIWYALNERCRSTVMRLHCPAQPVYAADMPCTPDMVHESKSYRSTVMRLHRGDTSHQPSFDRLFVVGRLGSSLSSSGLWIRLGLGDDERRAAKATLNRLAPRTIRHTQYCSTLQAGT